MRGRGEGSVTNVPDSDLEFDEEEDEAHSEAHSESESKESLRQAVGKWEERLQQLRR